MKHSCRNIMVYAEKNGNRPGFNVYLAFSGQREYLYTHRYNQLMFRLMKDGIRLDDLKRRVQDLDYQGLFPRRGRFDAVDQLHRSMCYLMTMIDEYIAEKEECA